MTIDVGRPYALVSADGHAGASVLGYRPYLEQAWHDEFDRWARTFIDGDGWGGLEDDAGLAISMNPYLAESPHLGLASTDRERDARTVRTSTSLSPINWASADREAMLRGQGIVAEVLFPNTVPPFYPSGVVAAPGPLSRDDWERRWAGLRAHNRWLAEFCAELPGRRAGIAQILLDDVDVAVAEVRWARDADLAGVLLPPDHHSGLANLYARALDPLWAVCAELAVPVHRHSIAVNGSSDPEAMAMGLYEVKTFFKRTLPQLVLGGVLERHPDLRFVFTEGGVAWALAELDGLEEFCALGHGPKGVIHRMAGEAVGALRRTPGDYFRSSCWAGSFLNPRDIAARHDIGVERIMWGADFPHHEGTAPFTTEALRCNFASVPEAEVRMMTSSNAAAVYGFDLDVLQSLAEEIGPSVGEIARPLAPEEYPEDSYCPTFLGAQQLVR